MTRSATAQAALVLRDLLGENHASANLAAIRDQDGNVSYAIHCDRKDEGKLLFEHGLSIEQLLDLADEIVQQGSDHPGFRTVEVDSEGNQTTDLEQGSARNEELMPGEIPDLPPGYIDERLAAGNPDLHGNPTRTDNPELVPANPTTPPASDE